jgi:hypothetical protein
MNLNTVIFDIETETMQGMHPWQKTAMGGQKPGEMILTCASRGTGKSYLNQLFGQYGAVMQMRNTPIKIQWARHDKHPLSLVATALAANDNEYINFLAEEDMVKVADWCKECNCGRRLSFDTVCFKNEKQITMFLMKWSS